MIPSEDILVNTVTLASNDPLHRRASLLTRVRVEALVRAEFRKGRKGIPFHLDFWGTADPPFQSTGSISKMRLTTGELVLLKAAWVMFPGS